VGAFDLVVATQDWHPADHGSFAVNHPGRKIGDVIEFNGLQQILWPTHCVQNTPGAEFVKTLDTSRIARVFRKGTDKNIDSYSGFFDNGHRKSTGLDVYLKEQGVTDVFVAGLATDYCVKFTALDARQLGFTTHLIRDASHGVNVRPGDVDRAVHDMRAAGVQVIQSADLGSVSGESAG
ncbi:MAG TPA: bifunctional nicotinamidase/pyrazinamidase, partial [Tepidisphaeraceae bacterium]|nr:bifunctional nicotinamidase/pyrazinamidase [Tepidisphaeraceae bacterium]